MKYTKGSELIAEERKRQIEKEGWTAKHDEQHSSKELVMVSKQYLDDYLLSRRGQISQFFPWAIKWWKPTPNDPIRQLTKAGALIAAEIDRLLRLRGVKG